MLLPRVRSAMRKQKRFSNVPCRDADSDADADLVRRDGVNNNSHISSGHLSLGHLSSAHLSLGHPSLGLWEVHQSQGFRQKVS